MKSIKNQQIRFQHIRKCGGTTINAVLREFCGQGNLDLDALLARNGEIDDIFALGRERPYLTGHSYVLDIAQPTAFRFAFFREPMSRLRSERRQITRASEADLLAAKAVQADATRALKEMNLQTILRRFYDHPVFVFNFWNNQTLSLGLTPVLKKPAHASRLNSSNYGYSNIHCLFEDGHAFRHWLEANSDQLLAEALQNLRRLDHIGIFEDFDNSVAELLARLGLPPAPDIIHLNARQPYDDENDPELAAVAAPLIALDKVLYAEARQQHRHRAGATPFVRHDYLGRVIDSSRGLVCSPDEAPGGHGWHLPHLHGTQWARWTQGRCWYAVQAGPGNYVVEIEAFGASSESAILELAMSINGEPLSVSVWRDAEGVWHMRAAFERRSGSLFDLQLDIPQLVNNCGIEMKQIAFWPQSPDGSAAHAGDNEAAKLQQLPLPERTEAKATQLALSAMRRFAGDLGLPLVDRLEFADPAGGNAGAMFATFDRLLQAAALRAEHKNIAFAPLQAEARDHVGYALARLADTATPQSWGDVAKQAGAFHRGSDGFAVMVWEAACNIASLLERMRQLLPEPKPETGTGSVAQNALTLGPSRDTAVT